MQFFVSEGMRYVMGTLLRVYVQGTSQSSVEAAKDSVLETVQKLEERLSIYREDSDLSRLNSGQAALTDLSLESRDALAQATQLKKATGGVYDPCLGGRWDLGGSGKGFALDRALAKVIAIPDVYACRFDFGGQLLFWDRDDNVSEVVVIEFPDYPGAPPEFWMKRRGSISTSAPFERGLHIVDPRTGRPVEARRSVTVIAPSAMAADAWSTALYVLGPDEGLARLSRHSDIEALWIDFAGDHPRLVQTPGWPAMNAQSAGIGTFHKIGKHR